MKVVYYDKEQNRKFVFLTNGFGLSALVIAKLYRNHWSVAPFFKWLKRYLKIKKFWGRSENTVRVQI